MKKKYTLTVALTNGKELTIWFDNEEQRTKAFNDLCTCKDNEITMTAYWGIKGKHIMYVFINR